MANRRKRLRDWQWTDYIMWWAFIFSSILHLCFVYVLPTVDILPADPGYIEVDESWLAAIPNDEVPSELRDTPTDEGTEPAATQDASTAWDFPPHVDAIEPVSATKRNTDNTWETAFIGVNPALSETLEPSEIDRTVSPQIIDADIPPRTLKEMVVRSYPKPLPTSDIPKISAHEPEVKIEADVEIQAEQRFQEALFSGLAQQTPKTFDPEPLSGPAPEIVEAEKEEFPTTPAMRAVSPQAIDADIPPRTLREMVVRSYSKPLPPFKALEILTSESEVTIEADVEIQAEQRFQETLFSGPAQQIPKNVEPEPLSVPAREILETAHEDLSTVTSTPRQATIQPIELESVSVIPSPTSAKSRPALLVPEIPERFALDDEEVIAATLDFPEPFAVSARPDPANELPETESQAPALFVHQKAVLPESHQHDRKMYLTAFLPQNANNARPALSLRASHKIRVSSFSESADKRELTLNDVEMQARKPVFSQRISQISEHVERPPDAPRPAMPKVPAARDRDEQMPVKGFSGTNGSLTKRSLILGAGDDVPTLPLEGPRFGILAKKEDSAPDEELTPDTELLPEESLQQAEQQPEQPSDEFVIEGPAAGRQVLLKPRQFPDVELDRDVTIRLKFWVLPDGTVAEVIPLQRGDVRLERVAIAYVKSWRFTPVSPEQPQVWGIIPIRYTLR